MYRDSTLAPISSLERKRVGSLGRLPLTLLTYPFSDMTGTCPHGAVPPDCYAGPKWTPNDPVFFLHHAVCGVPQAYLGTCNLCRRIVTQMIDKIWYDWQQKSPKNKYSYGGGSVEALASFATFTQFPTGLPPYLNVSSSPPISKQTCGILHASLTHHSSRVRFQAMVYGTLRFGT